MIQRLTVGELKKKIEKLPDNTIVCCQSDEEGNRTMVCDSVYLDKVGYVDKFNYDGQEFQLVGGEDVEGIDMEKDKGTYFITIHPLY